MTDQETTHFLILADEYFKRQEYSNAEFILNKILKSNYFNSRANELLAYLNAAKGNSSVAKDLLVRACSQQDSTPEAFYYLGILFLKSNNFNEAIFNFEKALLISPNFIECLHDLGTAYTNIGNNQKAIGAYQKALLLNQNIPELFYNLGNTYTEEKMYEEAITSYTRAIKIAPNRPEFWCNRGTVLSDVGRYEEALSDFDLAIKINANYPDAWYNKATTLSDTHNYKEALICYEKANSIANIPFCLGLILHHKMLICDWSNYETLTLKIQKLLRAGHEVIEPFGYQGISESENDLLLAANIFAKQYIHENNSTVNFVSSFKNKKIKIGYLSGEFKNQATAFLMVNLFECHDKTKFEIYAFDNGSDDQSDVRKRINNSFNKIINIKFLSDDAVVKLIQHHEIDILVNLNGYFGQARSSVFAKKPSPIQVNFLGFPGTIGAKWMDYIIADRVVIPESSRHFYSEKVCYLPETYQVNDSKRQFSNQLVTRYDAGLPQDGFVFCCFNNNYKITPENFNSWARILNRVPGSVLWLLKDNSWAKENLIRELLHRGISEKRLVFAEKKPHFEHLARHQLADLFLDTVPYNAHTTASDALWCGLPLLTLVGDTFPGRVAASLLNAIEMTELITTTRSEYEFLAIELATNPHKLSFIKEKLINNRTQTALFNTSRFTKHLEAAFYKMMDRYSLGMPPEQINVENLN